GRIAVWSKNISYGGFASVDGGIGNYNSTTGEVGTIVWGLIPPEGTVILVR
ncbi:MAG: hypothetical protein HQ548_03825, partial [Chloroflexi bacterium]|nr:hypothetical protein [Chloroflexota bacterium]